MGRPIVSYAFKKDGLLPVGLSVFAGEPTSRAIARAIAIR
jgi:hypothetical protein